ncbi:MAG: hypothetical protein Q7S06_01910 [Nanoarchaeota archaeon]|nr:hypothetical protein [Nanoarchaeota archaeon]
MIEQRLLYFITEARKRGFSDNKIKEALLDKGWQIEKIDKAFETLNPKFKSKNQVCVFLSDDLLNALEKRAKKNMQTISEQIEDILRKSCVTYKGGTVKPEKLDDSLVAVFSRKNTGKKKK